MSYKEKMCVLVEQMLIEKIKKRLDEEGTAFENGDERRNFIMACIEAYPFDELWEEIDDVLDEEAGKFVCGEEELEDE